MPRFATVGCERAKPLSLTFFCVRAQETSTNLRERGVIPAWKKNSIPEQATAEEELSVSSLSAPATLRAAR